MDRERIIEILSKIIHPVSGRSITETGILNDVGLDENGVVVILQAQKQQDPLINSIKKACIKVIQAEAGKNINVTVEILFPEGNSEKKKKKEILPGVKNIIAVASGKGGVGKSTVAVNLSVAIARKGYRVGLIDADVYGPSIPKMFGAENLRPIVHNADGHEWIEPIEKHGVKILSIGFFINSQDALIWRGPMATSALRQLIHQGNWGELDFLFIDLPPGTGDVHLTLVQEIAVTGAIIISTPQEIALADAIKGISMFESEKIKVPILGLIENMSWFTPAELPENRYYIFGRNGCRKLAEKMNIPLLGQIPIVQSICEDGDHGKPSILMEDSVPGKTFSELAENFLTQVDIRNKTLETTKRVVIKT